MLYTRSFIVDTFLDLTKEMERILPHWETLGLQFDIIYSGYLGNIAQIQTVKNIVERFLKPDGLFIVDPVMGDGGKLYAGFTQEFIAEMRELCSRADYILPNVTEACYLAGEPYGADIRRVFKTLQAVCPRPIVTVPYS